MKSIDIIDESGDKKYFTQIPNLIANHSTAVDQALYFQMKRYAGENGKCFATQETLMQKLGVGRQTYQKSLRYLIDKKWIRFIGLTGSKTRPIKTYAIVDIWKLNVMEYEKIPSETAVSIESKEKIPSETTIDTVQNSSKIPSETASIRRTYINKNQEEDIILAKQVSQVLEVFIKLNPTLSYGNKTQRSSAACLIEKIGFDRTLTAAQYAISVIGDQYSPRITTPFELKEKLGKLIAYKQKCNNSIKVKNYD